MNHRKLLEQSIDAQLPPLAEKIARGCNLEVGAVLKAMESFKQAAIDRLIEARKRNRGKLSVDAVNTIVADTLSEYLRQTSTD